MPIFAPADIICVAHTFLKLEQKKKKYTLKNESTYWLKIIFILFIFHSNFHFIVLFLSNSFCCKMSLCAIKLGADCTCLLISSVKFQTYNDVGRFYSSAGLSECCGKFVHMQSMGEERNEYRHSFLWLLQYGTEANALHYAVRISA
jgi:hypothetical protein